MQQPKALKPQRGLCSLLKPVFQEGRETPHSVLGHLEMMPRLGFITISLNSVSNPNGQNETDSSGSVKTAFFSPESLGLGGESHRRGTGTSGDATGARDRDLPLSVFPTP